MYRGSTMKFPSYYTELGQLIKELSSPVVNETKNTLKEVLHEPGEFDDDKALQETKRYIKHKVIGR